MSNLRQKAEQIKVEAAAERGNFEPRGVPKRVYSYWLEESTSKKADDIRFGSRRENFCHFWRVVAIWAPLMFLRRKAEEFLPFILGFIGLVGLAAFIYVCATNTGFLMGVLFLLGCFAVLATVMGICIFIESQIKKRAKDPAKVFDRIATVLFIGIGIAITAFIVTGLSLAMGVTNFLILVASLAVAVGIGWWVAPKIGALFERWEDEEKERRDAAYDAYIRGEGPNPFEKTKKEPGRIARFANGVVDFFILIAQASRAKKWKICPLVDIDTNV